MLFILYCENKDSSHTSTGPSASGTSPETGSAGSSSAKNYKALSAGERLLLETGLRETGISCSALAPDNMIERGPYGKPFFPSCPHVRFNFSHSGSLTACAFSDREVGLDIQAHDQLRVDALRIAKRFFTGPEYHALLGLSSDQAAMNSLFFRFWTIKEAYLKYVGCGLYAEPDSFLPVPDGHSSEPISSPCLPACRSDNPDCSSEIMQHKMRDGQSPFDPDPYFPGSRGRIEILKREDLLTPGVYVLLPAPAGYTMAVSAQGLPGEIAVRRVDAPHP